MRPAPSFHAWLSDLVLVTILLALVATLTAAMALQFVDGEIPCPLCLLQRVAMFGICFGIIHHVRYGYDGRNVGVSLLWALYLLIISVRQVLLNIVPRAGHAYPGRAVLGLHIPVWSVAIALAVSLAFAATLTVFDEERSRTAPSSPALALIGSVGSLFTIALCAINLGAVFLQCGLGACHTAGYKLL